LWKKRKETYLFFSFFFTIKRELLIPLCVCECVYTAFLALACLYFSFFLSCSFWRTQQHWSCECVSTWRRKKEERNYNVLLCVCLFVYLCLIFVVVVYMLKSQTTTNSNTTNTHTLTFRGRFASFGAVISYFYITGTVSSPFTLQNTNHSTHIKVLFSPKVLLCLFVLYQKREKNKISKHTKHNNNCLFPVSQRLDLFSIYQIWTKKVIFFPTFPLCFKVR